MNALIVASAPRRSVVFIVGFAGDPQDPQKARRQRPASAQVSDSTRGNQRLRDQASQRAPEGLAPETGPEPTPAALKASPRQERRE